MDLTPETKQVIDEKSYTELLKRWRFAPIGNPWFQGETGVYWGERIAELKDKVDHVQVSKSLGW